jgi:hypothetical protein
MPAIQTAQQLNGAVTLATQLRLLHGSGSYTYTSPDVIIAWCLIKGRDNPYLFLANARRSYIDSVGLINSHCLHRNSNSVLFQLSLNV